MLDLSRMRLNCSEVSVLDREGFLDQFLLLDCDTRQRDVKKSWLLPGNVPVSGANVSAAVHDGKLQLGPLRPEHAGVYTCVGEGDAFNETLVVTVLVLNGTASGGLEGLKTAYTTLVACLVSVVMVIVYLFFTPCSYACCRGDGLKAPPPDSLRSSTVSVSQQEEEEGAGPGGHGGGAYGHRGGGAKEQNGRLNPIGEEDEERQFGDRRRSESVSSVCSDTPMVV